MIRGVRGAIQAEVNEESAILTAAEKLMRRIIETNNVTEERVSAVFFTVTEDLNAAYPAAVRKNIGWNLVPLLCSQEIPVPGSLPRVIRILILFETEVKPELIRHQYIGAARVLRPDLNEAERSGKSAAGG